MTEQERFARFVQWFDKHYPPDVEPDPWPAIRPTNVPQLVDMRHRAGLRYYYQRVWYAPHQKPVPVKKQVLRSLCHDAGVHKVYEDRPVDELIPSSKPKTKKTWTGVWNCNACDFPTEPYQKTVEVLNPFTHLYQAYCVDEFENLVPPARHDVDMDAMTCERCGSQAQLLDLGYKHDNYFIAIKKSKKDTFHACDSPQKARELGCPHWNRCKFTTEKMKSWGRNRETRDFDFQHIKNCPTTIHTPKTPNYGYAKPKPKKEKLAIHKTFAQILSDMQTDKPDKPADDDSQGV